MLTGVLLINLGTPKSFLPSDVKEYLLEFLLDPYVIDLPWLVRQILVRGVIVPFRYKESAHLYQKIWFEDGSPLMVYGKNLKARLQESLGDNYLVELAMRYQELRIEDQIESFLKKGVKKILFLPLFPQYAEATTGSIIKQILLSVQKRSYFPDFEVISHFETFEPMIQLFSERIQEKFAEGYDHLMLSFHGLPERHLKKMQQGCLNKSQCCDRQEVSGCYRRHCMLTARAIAEKLSLSPQDYSVTFQSRLGKDPWIQPYTLDTAKQLLGQGKKRILVACPAFVADCIETLSEIAVEYHEEFIKMGGEKLTLVPSLNDHPKWVEGLKELVLSRS